MNYIEVKAIYLKEKKSTYPLSHGLPYLKLNPHCWMPNIGRRYHVYPVCNLSSRKVETPVSRQISYA